MTCILNTIEIERPVEDVFVFVTTPAFWQQWHPSTLAVAGDTGHSLRVGEQVIEEFRAAGRRDRARWTVRECEPPHRWVIEGQGDGGGEARITYTLAASGQGTRFERELVYRMPNLFLRGLDGLLIRRRIAAESAEAVRRLKAVLEAR